MTEVEQVIKYAKMLNSKNLSALRSGNISIRYNDGFFITPSGAKYDSLKKIMTKAVMVQISTVSIKGSNKATTPSEAE